MVSNEPDPLQSHHFKYNGSTFEYIKQPGLPDTLLESFDLTPKGVIGVGRGHGRKVGEGWLMKFFNKDGVEYDHVAQKEFKYTLRYMLNNWGYRAQNEY